MECHATQTSMEARHRSRRRLLAATAAIALLAPAALNSYADAAGRGSPEPVRFATFNASLNRGTAGALGA